MKAGLIKFESKWVMEGVGEPGSEWEWMRVRGWVCVRALTLWRNYIDQTDRSNYPAISAGSSHTLDRTYQTTYRPALSADTAIKTSDSWGGGGGRGFSTDTTIKAVDNGRTNTARTDGEHCADRSGNLSQQIESSAWTGKSDGFALTKGRALLYDTD
jgi:hypothetical protein